MRNRSRPPANRTIVRLMVACLTLLLAPACGDGSASDPDVATQGPDSSTRGEDGNDAAESDENDAAPAPEDVGNTAEISQDSEPNDTAQTDSRVSGDDDGQDNGVDSGDDAGGLVPVYDFERLGAIGMINKQDNWVDQPGQGTAYVMSDDSAINGTRVLRHLPTVAFQESAYVTRVNDDSFSFPPFTGNERKAAVEFDTTGEHIAVFALGRDLDGDGMLKAVQGELGPAFGVHARKTTERMFRIQTSGLGEAVDVPLGPGNAGADWYRVRLTIDFLANAGDGSASLSYRNLTDGDAEYRTVAGLEDVGLRLSRLAVGAAPAAWNAMWLHLRAGGSNNPSVDNLVPHAR